VVRVQSGGWVGTYEKPIATALRTHELGRVPGVKRMVRGSAIASPSRLASSVAVAQRTA